MTDKPRMAPHPEAPPGLEQDGKGNPIPFEKRTQEDKDKVRQAIADGIGAEGGAAGPHNTPDQVNRNSTPGTGILPEPGKADDDDMAPTG